LVSHGPVTISSHIGTGPRPLFADLCYKPSLLPGIYNL